MLKSFKNQVNATMIDTRTDFELLTINEQAETLTKAIIDSFKTTSTVKKKEKQTKKSSQNISKNN